MMKSLLFAGQGAQFSGMGKDLYDQFDAAQSLIETADDVLGYKISEIMFEGDDETLKQTKYTQPALYVHAMAQLACYPQEEDIMFMAGHSLGECTALAASGTVTFEDGLRIVQCRAEAMQAACDLEPSTMAAIVGLSDDVVEQVCADIDDVVVPANYNSPGQLVISGSKTGITQAIAALQEKGAKRAIELAVAGAFHSPLMEPAAEELKKVLDDVDFITPSVPIVQNVTAVAVSDPTVIKENILKQLTAPVLWTKCVQYMIAEGCTDFTEVGGNGRVLTGLMRRIDRSATMHALIPKSE